MMAGETAVIGEEICTGDILPTINYTHREAQVSSIVCC